jgi:hypothetical protein
MNLKNLTLTIAYPVTMSLAELAFIPDDKTEFNKIKNCIQQNIQLTGEQNAYLKDLAMEYLDHCLDNASITPIVLDASPELEHLID